MIHYLEDCPKISHGDMAELLYGNHKAKGLSMLKPKLLERMLETLNLSINPDHKALAKEDPASQIQLELLKQLNYALTLRMRGCNQLAREILEKCETRAVEFGYPGLQLQAQTMLRSMSDSLEEIQTHFGPEMQSTLEAYQSDLMSQAYMDEYRVMTQMDRMPDEEMLREWLRERICNLEKRLEVHYSRRAHLHWFILRENLCRIEGAFQTGRQVVQEIEDLLTIHPGLKSRYREGLPHLHLADLELRCYHWQAALQAATSARALFYPGRRIHYRAGMLKMLSQLYLGDWAAAAATTQELLSVPAKHELRSLRPLVEYLHLCQGYLNGDLNSVKRSIQWENPLNQDKRGWNVGIRLMEIIILVDLAEYETASLRIETLRKHLSNHQALEARSVLIYRYLYQLERNSFSFEATSKKTEEIMDDLAELTQWNPIGYEVVRFESWLKAKQEGRPVAEVLKEDWRKLA